MEIKTQIHYRRQPNQKIDPFIFTSKILLIGIGIVAVPIGLIASALTKTKD